jgi:hypothetical protein
VYSPEQLHANTPHLLADRHPYADQEHSHRSNAERLPYCNPYYNRANRRLGQRFVQSIARDPSRQAAEK